MGERDVLAETEARRKFLDPVERAWGALLTDLSYVFHNDEATVAQHRPLIEAALLVTPQPEAGLDAAWAEAEAALPEGWRGPVLRRSSVVEGQYQAQAFDPDEADLYEYADTPAAALLALAAALREPKP